ncbi:hypothetical protein GO755_07775 [Spirosoma sp. HMF4905]|uniref:Uncharacterized protein n=1 Tax=Spirosoma arboris TaxID=2682092 RepID=A0A7K1S8K1_9BACT|nr:hypothetical protein [Spirosoma arboris]MVM29926.1 hypothetical protein [Spirosoma arboris]
MRKSMLIVLTLAVISSVIYYYLADTFFSKSDAIEELANMKIKIKDDFTVVQNETSNALGDYSHVFKLKISKNDARAVDKTIRLSTDYDTTDLNSSAFFPKYTGNRLKTWVIKDYKNAQMIIRDQYFPIDTGIIASFKRVSLKRDTLTFYNVIE